MFSVFCFAGVKKCPWLRWPCVVYGSHVATTLLPIMAHVAQHDFSKDAQAGPSTTEERLTLISFYIPYFVFPICIMLDALFSSAYRKRGDHHMHKNKHI